MLKGAIEKLISRQDLSSFETTLAIQEMVSQANPHQAAAFLVLMRAKGETVDEINGIVDGMRHHMLATAAGVPVLDIVGTGGDGAHTLNISTASAILAASCGVKIAKHGNRSVSSLCGSADVLEALGISLEQSPSQIVSSIQNIGIGFFFAPQFHPAMRMIKEIRRSLNVPTCFNLIGPLLNPACAEHLMIGVFDEKLLSMFAHVLQKQKTRRSLVFYGEGLDELSCIGPAKGFEVTAQVIRPFTLNPTDFGLKQCTIEDLRGKDAAYNAEKMIETFSGAPGGFADTVALNAGVALYLYGTVDEIAQGIKMAQDHLKEKKALALLQKWKMYAS